MANNREQYICLSAMLRAREPRMVTGEQAHGMTGLPSYEEAVRVLADCGYEGLEGLNAAGVSACLEQRQARIIDEIRRLSPDPEAVDLFSLRYDYHNAKVILKSEARGLNPGELMMSGGRISPERLENCYGEDKLVLLPEDLAHALAAGKEVLSRTGNPQKADFLLDTAYFAKALKLAETLESPWVTGYVKLLIDAANLRSGLRSYRLGKDETFLSEVITEGGTVSRQVILSCGDAEGLLALYATGYLKEAAALAEDALHGSMTAFEKAVDNGIMAYLKSSSLINYGPEVVVAYLGALDTETTAVRMILTGHLLGVPADRISERLRDMYA